MTQELKKAIEKAKERGKNLIKNLRDKKELFNEDEFLFLIQKSPKQLQKLEESYFVIFIRQEGQKLYPNCQLDKNNKPFEFIKDLNEIYNHNHVAIFRFLTNLPKKYHNNKYKNFIIEKAKSEKECEFT